MLLAKSLTIANGGILDLANNDLMIDYTGASPLATIQSYINSARNGGGFNGTGPDSSSRRAMRLQRTRPRRARRRRLQSDLRRRRHVRRRIVRRRQPCSSSTPTTATPTSTESSTSTITAAPTQASTAATGLAERRLRRQRDRQLRRLLADRSGVQHARCCAVDGPVSKLESLAVAETKIPQRRVFLVHRPRINRPTGPCRTCGLSRVSGVTTKSGYSPYPGAIA